MWARHGGFFIIVIQKFLNGNLVFLRMSGKALNFKIHEEVSARGRVALTWLGEHSRGPRISYGFRSPGLPVRSAFVRNL